MYEEEAGAPEIAAAELEAKTLFEGFETASAGHPILICNLRLQKCLQVSFGCALFSIFRSGLSCLLAIIFLPWPNLNDL